VLSQYVSWEMKKIFGVIRVGITAYFRKLRNIQLLLIVCLINYYSGDQITSEFGVASGMQGAKRNG